jgi:hypothetical protein
VGHFDFELDVFADTPTGNQLGPPSTSFSRAERLHPSGVRLRSGSLRSPSLRLTPEGWRRREERQFTERVLHPHKAIKRAHKTIKNLCWFQVVETRGAITKGKVDHWQVTIKVGFTVEG